MSPFFSDIASRLSRPLGKARRAVMTAVAAAVFSLSLPLAGWPSGSGGMAAAVLFIALFAVFLPLFLRELKNVSLLSFLAAALILATALFVRFSVLDYRSGDYNDFLSEWLAYFSSNGGFSGLSGAIGDYNTPYLYFLALFSYLPVSGLYLIKLLSVTFDLILTLFAMKTLRHFSGGDAPPLLALLIVALMPTFWLNSALWGQCDSIYSALILISFLCALKQRGLWCVIFAAAAFSFKLQTVFFLPVLLIFLILRRIKWTDLLAFPATFFLMILPALIAGRPLASVAGIYSSQIRQYSQYLVLNAPTVMNFAPRGARAEVWSACGIAAASLFILAVTVFARLRRARLGDRELLLCAALLLCAVPFLLPSMHDRYFYPAELFMILFSLIFPKRIYAFLLCSFASYTGYHAYLTRSFLVDMRLSSIIMLICILIAAARLFIPSTGRDGDIMST